MITSLPISPAPSSITRRAFGDSGVPILIEALCLRPIIAPQKGRARRWRHLQRIGWEASSSASGKKTRLRAALRACSRHELFRRAPHGSSGGCDRPVSICRETGPELDPADQDLIAVSQAVVDGPLRVAPGGEQTAADPLLRWHPQPAQARSRWRSMTSIQRPANESARRA